MKGVYALTEDIKKEDEPIQTTYETKKRDEKKENVNIIKFDYEKENAIRFNSTYCFSLCLL